MARFGCLLIGLVFFQHTIQAQPLVGMKKANIISYMNQHQPGFALDNTIINKQYNYLKFYDRVNEETILCFLTEDDVCNVLRRMSDYSNLDMTIKRLDTENTRIGTDKWSYTFNGQEFVVELKKEKWYFTLETRRKK
jgi:hypothetical protein